MMSPRENLLAALRHAQGEWIPWTPYVGGVNTLSFVPEEMKRRQDLVEIGLFMQDVLGCDILISGEAFRRTQQTASRHKDKQDDSIIETFEIAGRALERVHRTFAYGDQETSAILRYPVRTIEDMGTLGWLFEDQLVEAGAPDWEDKAARLGDRGVVHANAPRTPIMALVIEYMGLEAFLYALVDHQAEVEQLMATMHRANLAIYETLAETPCEVVGTFDDFDTSLISPAMFRKYVLPCLKDYADVVHRAGKLHMVHACGHIRALLPMCLEVGYDAHNYLTAPPTGNTPLAEAKSAWRDAITIMAPVDPVRLEMGRPEEIRDRTTELIKLAADLNSFVVMTSSKPTVPQENLMAVAETLQSRAMMGIA